MIKPFEAMPDISEYAETYMKNQFEPYIFVETIKRGFWKYTCSTCGAELFLGRGILKRTETAEERELTGAEHNSVHPCPQCGTQSTLKNIGKCKIENLSEYKHVAIFLQGEDGAVWVRCFNYYKHYYSRNSQMQKCEKMRYRLAPGEATMWEQSDYHGWWRQQIVRDAFLWNHGYFCEKYPYTVFEDGMRIRDSFLKYHSFDRYEGPHGYGFPFMKYLCWYARHPQIEMLVKFGLFKTVDQMVLGNTDCRQTLDWSAKTPWDLHRLSKPLYQIWRERFYSEINVLKVFNKLKGTTEKEMETAEEIRDYCGSLKQAYRMISLCKKMKIEPGAVMRYCRKKAGKKKAAWNFRETFEMWLDYIDMAKVVGTLATVSPFPANLKAAHDGMISAHNIATNKADAKKLKEEAAKAAAPIKKKFPKVEKIYKEIAEKYSYSDGTFAVVVPSGIEDIMLDGMVLAHCTIRTDRYYERICSKESFILFLRHADDPDIPWYALEVEPGGTIRQKRTKGDVQLEDLKEAIPFLNEWQKVVSERMTAADKRLAQKSKILRNEGFEELRRTKKVINYGPLQGQYLIDALERDLMEAGA